MSTDDSLADAIHALQAPLTVLRVGIEKALETSDPSSLREILRDCAREVETLTGVVANLLLLARMDAADFVPEKKPVDVTALARDAVSRFRAVAEARGIKMDFVADRSAVVSGDPELLSQLLFALLDNAVKYTPPGGAVSVESILHEGTVRLRVSDTGIGVPTGALPRIFDRFFRVDCERGGAGLGLAIAKSIADAHEGSLTAESVPGQGTRFTLELGLRY